jgi:hypothetical protein
MTPSAVFVAVGMLVGVIGVSVLCWLIGSSGAR